MGEKATDETKRKFYEKFVKGELDDNEIEITLSSASSNQPSMPTFDIPGMPGGQMGVLNMGDMIGKMLGDKKSKASKMKVKDAYEQLIVEESDKLLDNDKIIKEAIHLTEQEGIVFLDEIDKIACRVEQRGEVSREGVQRDLLPLIEGSIVTTRHGAVKTDHILFVASGAFHLAKPADLLPELQGRLPIRVELNPLSEDDMVKILTEPIQSLPKQYEALFAVEKVTINFTEDGIRKIARIATEINREVENIGARRLHTILEKLLESVNYTASDTPGAKIEIDEKYVESNLEGLVRKIDLSKFIL